MAELIKIQFLRGTKDQIETANNDAGKPYFATDTKELYVSDGTSKHLAGKVQYGTAANLPTAGALIAGKLYFATDTSVLYICNGSAWVTAGIVDLADAQGSLDDIADGATYGKVKNTELVSGQVKQIRAVSGAVNISGDDIKSHFDDGTIHFVIDDVNPSTTKVYSSQKVQDELNAILAGMIRQPAVKSRTNTPPGTPATGDRYLIGDTPTGVWAGHANNIVEWTGSAWSYRVPAEGWVVYNDATNTDWLYVDDGTGQWEERTVGVTAHNDLQGLNDGDYKHLTAAEFTKATTPATGATDGLMSASDKTKLDGIMSGAEENPAFSEHANGGVKVVTTSSGGHETDIAFYADFEDSDSNILAVRKGNVGGLAGTSKKVARADHRHALVDVDAGTL